MLVVISPRTTIIMDDTYHHRSPNHDSDVPSVDGHAKPQQIVSQHGPTGGGGLDVEAFSRYVDYHLFQSDVWSAIPTLFEDNSRQVRFVFLDPSKC